MRHLAVVLLALTACTQSFDPLGAGDDAPAGPGSPTWDDTNLTCKTERDCAPGETCDSGSCRPRQCDDGPYESAQPLGPRHVFFREQEILIADATPSNGSFWADGYDAAGAVRYDGPGGGSFDLGGAAIVDIARIVTKDGSGFVSATAGSTKVRASGRGFAPIDTEVGLVPIAVAADDIDGDGVAEVVAIDAAGQIAICALGGSCRRFQLGAGAIAKDLATGDTNGDGIAEVVFLLRVGDTTQVLAWTVDGETVAASFEVHFEAVAVGDIDHDGRAEVAVLEDRGWFGFASDRIHAYRVGTGFTGITAVATTGSAIDLSSGDLDGNDTGDVIVVLGDNRKIDVLRWNGSGIASTFTGTANATTTPKRVAVGDLDDDSVSARLVSGPELVAGRLVPTVVVTFPPYDASLARGGEASVSIGNKQDVSEDAAQTVSLQAGVEVGVDADFAGLFKAKLSTKLQTEVTRSRSLGKKTSIGTKFSLRPQLELYGNHYAAVVVACNCFHSYEYELVDPGNRAGGTGRRVVMIVPVGGQTTVLSTPRYAALAAQTGMLADVGLATRIGDVASYPKSPTKLDGTPVQPDEHVFPNRPTLRVSDVGTVAFSMAVGRTETNSAALKTSVSVTGSVSALGVMVGGSLGVGWGQSYSITIGESAEFSGEVPPLPDDPATQEDEYQTRAYSYSPYVYRQPYADPQTGEPSGYYVLDYAVGAP
jgi:hypothetical protein